MNRFTGPEYSPTALHRLFALALAASAWIAPLSAQTSLSTDGAIESTSGGFIFPDGTVQTTALSGGVARVEDSGQDACWNADGDEITCAGTGHDGALQEGVDWPAPRFVDNGDGTVSDRLTGLVWLADANCFGPRLWTLAVADAYALASGSCGLADGSEATDWRLPNVKQLASLLDYSEQAPAIPAGHPFLEVQGVDFYWTSTTAVSDTTQAWTISLEHGLILENFKIASRSVWPVRAEQ